MKKGQGEQKPTLFSSVNQDGVHNECRFCGEWPYTGIDCPEDAIVPDRKKCDFG